MVDRDSIMALTRSLSAILASQLMISNVLFRKWGLIWDCSALMFACWVACCSRYARSNCR